MQVQVIDGEGNYRLVQVQAIFSERINGQLFGFVVHKSLTLSRMILTHAKSGQRIGVLNDSKVQRVGLEAAGREALRLFITLSGEVRAASTLNSFLPVNATELKQSS